MIAPIKTVPPKDIADRDASILRRIISHIFLVDTEDADGTPSQPRDLHTFRRMRRLSFGVATSFSTVSKSIVRNRTRSASTPGAQSLRMFEAIVSTVLLGTAGSAVTIAAAVAVASSLEVDERRRTGLFLFFFVVV
jgi:hypothetical protein